MIKYILLIVVFGAVGAAIAKPKGRNPALWFVLCGLIPFLIVAIALLPSIEAKGLNKKCPNCSEVIKENARVCKFCGMGV